MCTFLSLSNPLRPASILILLAVTIAIMNLRTSFASRKDSVIDEAMLLVLDNCDSDNNHTTPPYGDDVFLLNSNGELALRFRLGLTIGSNWGGGRAISTAEDGRYFLVCEDVTDKITVCETVTGIKVWSLSGVFKSAVFANDQIYALNNESVFAIDNTGTIVKHSRIGGFDIVVDTSGDCLWIVGGDIKKCSLGLKIMMTVDPIQYGACSVDINSDGSIWVAERVVDIPKADVPKGRLLRLSSQGSVLKAIDLNISPVCVRVNKYDGSVWITGTRERHRDFSLLDKDWPDTVDELNKLIGDETESHTLKYNPDGKLLLSIIQGGGSIDLDPSDGSIWIAGRKKIWHYSSTGTNLVTYTDVSDSQKCLAVVPRKTKAND